MHGISESTFYELLTEVPRAINEVYSDEIHFPLEDPQKLKELSQGFYLRSGQTMAGIVGALDGVVLTITKPSLLDVPNPSDHWNRKGHYAVVYQVLVDSKMKVQWFCCKSTGNTNDSVAFDTSSLKNLLDSHPLAYPFFIIGDEAYKSSGHVATPYPGCNLDEDKDAFNFYHSRTRMIVEQAFGLFKNTWRMYSRPSQLALDHFQEVTRAAFRLHNIVIDDKAVEGDVDMSFSGSYLETGDFQYGDVVEAIMNDEPLTNVHEVKSSEIIRDCLCQYLKEHGLLRPRRGNRAGRAGQH
eukprot:scaffold143736_cov17-Prasinocladus_malaysianus.AAC.1